MKRYYVVTVHPRLIEGVCQFGPLKRAQALGLAKVHPIDLRDFAVDRHGSVDARPYGGGDGMVLRPEPLADAVTMIRKEAPRAQVILLTPGGQQWTQIQCESHHQKDQDLIFICGRFAGVDQRFIDLYVDYEYSIGDVILAGGELPALVMIESLVRLLPGALGHEESALLESFSPAFEFGLEHPLYTRPQFFGGLEVPAVLLSGNHGDIDQWKRTASRERTVKSRGKSL
jgi:tRNA (guanine37-N1)-methyltransferase